MKKKNINKINGKKKKHKGAKRTLISICRKLQRFLLRLVSLALTIAIYVGVITGVLQCTGMSRILSDLDFNNHTEYRKIAETDTAGFKYYETPETDIVTDKGITYAGNEILVALNSEKNKGDLDKYLESINASIVGSIDELAEYQILLNKKYTYTEIKEIKDSFESLDWVNYASPNYMIKADLSYTPNDSRWKDKWEDMPDGNNWGMEAIDAPGAWEYKDELSDVNIGILDSQFDVNHEDLIFSEKPLYNDRALKNDEIKWDNHGTHVAGTIAATFDNKKGVTGVSIHTNLYGVSVEGLETQKYQSMQGWNIAFNYLIAKKKCKVVNVSMGYDQISFEASKGEKVATEALNEWSTQIGNFLKILIDKKYSFVICAASGNQNKVTKKDVKYLYFRKDANDPLNTSDSLAYYSYKDFKDYCSIFGNKKGKEYFSYYKNKKNEIEKRLEGGNVDAKFGLFGAIKDETVKKRIIIVGSVENLGTKRQVAGIIGKKKHKGYRIAELSQCGARVDVVAPGEDIYSTIKNKYGLKSGTSMASPHVTGVVGLIFSAKPDIDADLVKKIIIDSAEGSYGTEEYGLVNAKNAVEMVRGNSSHKKSEAINDRQQENSDSEASAYEIYQNAAKKITDTGAWREKMDGTVEMKLSSADGKQKSNLKVNIDAGGDVSNYNQDDLSALKVSAYTNIQVGGQKTSFTVNYEDGIAHYQYTEPTTYSADMELDSVYFEFSKMTPDMMKDASVKGSIIDFTVNGEQLTELTAELTNMLSGVENLQYDDADVEVVLDKKTGRINNVIMQFHVSMIYEGYITEADYDINYSFAV